MKAVEIFVEDYRESEKEYGLILTPDERARPWSVFVSSDLVIKPPFGRGFTREEAIRDAVAQHRAMRGKCGERR